jgi:Ni/Fe-hydrogenase 1 B-type cytochrome subunit
MQATRYTPLADAHHPQRDIGPARAIYVWQYPLRFFHWGTVISLAVLSVSGYYIHAPYVVGQWNYPFLMGWVRFTHETFGMILIALFVLRIYLFFKGNRWVRWRRYVPLSRAQFEEMGKMFKFYTFLSHEPVSKIGHNALAAAGYLTIFGLLVVEMATGLTLYNLPVRNGFLTLLVGWIPHVMSIQTVRLIHFFLMFVFIAFAIFHTHVCMVISRQEKRGLMDSIFTGYKIIPEAEIAEEERKELAGE